MKVIEERKAKPSARSYTAELFAGGTQRISAKIIEEAGEVVEAAARRDQDPSQHSRLVHEACDLIYHLLVMLGHHEIKLHAVEAELARRFGVSGLDEKASRAEPPYTTAPQAKPSR